MGKFFKIPIERFRAGCALRNDTYIYFELNKKSVRIANAGGDISPELLERLLKKHTYLEIESGEDLDPTNYSIHVDELSSEVTLVASSAATPETEQVFSPDAHTPETITQITGGNEPDNTSEQRFGSDKDEKEAVQRISGAKEDEEDVIRRFAGGAEPKDTAVFRVSGRLAKAQEEIRIGKGLDLGNETMKRDFKSILLSSKICEQIIAYAEENKTALTEVRGALRAQIRNLTGVLDIVDAGEDVDELLTGGISVDQEFQDFEAELKISTGEEQLKLMSEKISANTRTKGLARAASKLQDAEELETRRSESRDRPAAITRIAAYLGHSLGYSNVDYLADLATAAVVHFAKKSGDTILEAALLPLSKKLFTGSTDPDSTLDDSRDILLFLDAYIDDAEYDITQKDLVKKVFDRTLQELANKEEAPSPFNIQKWTSFMERGPSMDSHSICTRAAAMALKSARNAVN